MAKFREEVTLTAIILQMAGVSHFVVTGDTNVAARDIIVQQMMNGDLEAVVATIDVAGEGLNLPTCKVVVVISIDVTPGSFLQLSNRTSRFGGKRKPIIIVITPDTTVTNRKLQGVLRKKIVNERLLDSITDHYTPSFPSAVTGRMEEDKERGCKLITIRTDPPFVGRLLWYNGEKFSEGKIGETIVIDSKTELQVSCFDWIDGSCEPFVGI